MIHPTRKERAGKRSLYRGLILAAVFGVVRSTALAGPADGTEHVQARLVPGVKAVVPGSTFWVGVRLIHQPHWHTYWKNPGDAGLPTSIDWRLPDGFSAGEIRWPAPRWLSSLGQVSFGYEDDVVLLSQLQAPAELPTAPVRIEADVKWLECRDVCIPGEASLALVLPVGAENEPLEPLNAINQALAALPVDGEDWQAAAVAGSDRLTIEISPPAGLELAGDIRFFPEAEYVINYDDGLPVTAVDGKLSVSAPLNPARPGLPEVLYAVLVRGDGEGAASPRAVRVRIPIESTAEPTPAPSATTGAGGMLYAIGFAFLGGIILNAMPCVFPVISLKILGFVELAESDPRRIWKHGLTFAVGVVLSFWALAGILLAVKAATPSAGWGFQLTQPGFVVAIGIFFLLLSLNLFGVFEWGLSLASAGSRWNAASSGYAGSLLSGVLATLVATPCTGPFMGAAIGFALTQPAWVAMAVFTSLGVGMATPYLLLSRFPAWLRALPQPGPWMVTLKQALGFVLLAFVLFLIWQFAALRGSEGLARLLVALLLAAVGAWIFGRWGSVVCSRRSRLISAMVALALLAAGGAYAAAEPPADDWLAYSETRISRLRRDGQPVFIDFTATWCVTCQFNKRTVLNTDPVQAKFKEKGVALIKADWTHQPEPITRALAEFGRSGVPLYVLYGDDPEAEPQILPEFLTQAIVLDALAKLP